MTYKRDLTRSASNGLVRLSIQTLSLNNYNLGLMNGAPDDIVRYKGLSLHLWLVGLDGILDWVEICRFPEDRIIDDSEHACNRADTDVLGLRRCVFIVTVKWKAPSRSRDTFSLSKLRLVSLEQDFLLITG